ncbi:aminotransferase class III-fold pyridoxal phosphate-dependent enzyme [Pseudomonas aeruginosa]
MNNIETFERLESNVRMYCRDLPLVFDTAQGSRIRGEDGREYLDFFAGAGALNYGHNDPRMRDALIAYLSANGVTHALDLHTTTKRQFLEAIERDLFKPRGWDYKVQFTGPTGADAVEAALKLARKATGRTKVVSFYGAQFTGPTGADAVEAALKLARKATGRTKVVSFYGAYHGMTAGALAVTGNRTRRGPGLSTDVVFVPYEDSPYGEFDSIGFLERLANDQGSGSELPAAVIVESVQIQAGVYPASNQWLQRLRKWTTDHGVLLICDEIQAGCGRTGDFFGFERSGVVPDLITCAKSIGGFGLPMAIVLLRAGLDVWQPGDHIGTFRGNQLAFLTARIALSYWHDEQFLKLLADNCAAMERAVAGFAEIPGVASARCRGMIAGIDFGRGNVEVAKDAQQRVLQAGVLVDRCGPNGEIIKLMPPLNTPTDQLEDGLRAFGESVAAALGE